MILCDAVYASREALRIAVDQARPKITNVAVLKSAAAQRAVSVRARDTVVNENKPGSVQKSARGESQIGVHIHLRRFASLDQ